VKNILLYIWQLPQAVLGSIFWLSLRLTDKFDKKIPTPYGVAYYHKNMKDGISLGPFIFIKSRYRDKDTLLHETGHQRQSLYLGPLYLFVIGIPSAIHYLFWSPKSLKSYYKFWCEAWADKLGGLRER